MTDKPRKPLKTFTEQQNEADANKKPVPFFATIHHDHYKPGEVARINQQLLDRYYEELEAENGNEDSTEDD